MGKSNHIESKLVVLSIVFLSLSKLTNYLSPLVFLGLAPLFGIYDLYQKGKTTAIKFILLTGLSLIAGFWFWKVSDDKIDFNALSQALFQGVLMSFAFIFFWFTNKYAKNRIGLLTVVIYWLALEYCSLQISYLSSDLLISNALSDWGAPVSWHEKTGWLGVSLWIVVGNIIFYYVLFKDNAIFQKNYRWLSFVYAILFLSIPFLYGYWYGEPQIIEVGLPNQEYLGRTALWVSMLLISYGFVKSQIRK